MSDLPLTENKTQTTNPLLNYFRQPKIYIKLPSKGKYYPPNTLDLSENGEYAVYAMTAKDELMFKTPDALMNGSATIEVIKSCIPSIKNPWQMPSIDIDAVLIGIRIATYGENMDISSECPSCGHFNEFGLDLVQYLEHAMNFNYEDTLSVGPLMVHLRPYSYKEVTKSALKTLEQQKIFQIINDDDLSDEEKIEKFGNSFVKLTEMTVDVVAGCVAQIDTPEGSVNDPVLIKEFINNSPADVFKTISGHISKLKDEIALKTQKVSCQECKHDFELEVTMDQTNFFVTGS